MACESASKTTHRSPLLEDLARSKEVNRKNGLVRNQMNAALCLLNGSFQE
jgi:hypothetical protein